MNLTKSISLYFKKNLRLINIIFLLILKDSLLICLYIYIVICNTIFPFMDKIIFLIVHKYLNFFIKADKRNTNVLT